MTYYRVQLASRDVTELLDPGHQFSHAYDGNGRLTQPGVSACTSLDDLAEYLISGQASAFTVRDGGWVIVAMEAKEIPDSRPVDVGEVLVRPTRIVSVTPADDDFFALMDAREQAVFGDFGPLFDDEGE